MCNNEINKLIDDFPKGNDDFYNKNKWDNCEFEKVEEKAIQILNTWNRTDLINDILNLTSKEGLREFVKEND